MFKIRLIGVALLGALTISAAVASSASAGWLVEGGELTSSAALTTTALVDETSTLLVPVLGLSVVCGGSKLDGLAPEIVTGNTLKAKALTFLGCNTTAPASGCALKESNQPITTVAVKASAQEAGYPEDRLTFTPQTKTTLANIEFNEANTCAFNGLQPVTGALTLNAPTLQEELATQPIAGLGSVENNSLQIAGDKAYIDGGRALLSLASGKSFEFVAILGLKANVASIKFPDTQKTMKSIAVPVKFTWKGIGKSGVLEQAEVGNGTEIAFKLAKDKCDGLNLVRNGSCEAEVIFEPPMAKSYKGSLKIHGRPESEVKLEGTGTA